MPFMLLIIGLVLIAAAVRNKQQDFIALLGGDFSGSGNFVYWIVALIVIGAVGYIPKAKPVSDGLLVLILLALVLTRGNPKYPGGGVFSQLETALGTTSKPSSASITGATNATITATGIDWTGMASAGGQ